MRNKKRIKILERKIDFLFKVLIENEAFKASLDSGKWYKEEESK